MKYECRDLSVTNKITTAVDAGTLIGARCATGWNTPRSGGALKSEMSHSARFAIGLPLAFSQLSGNHLSDTR